MLLSILFSVIAGSAQAYQSIPLSCKKVSSLLEGSEAKLAPSRQIRPGKPKPSDWVLNVAHYDKAGNDSCRTIIDENVEQLVNTYPEDVRQGVEALIDQIRDNSFLRMMIPARAYLFGPNEALKSEFANTLGKVLGLPVCHIFVDRNEPTWISELEQCLRYSKYANPIIHLEGAQGLMNGRSSIPDELRGLVDDSIRKYVLEDGTQVDTSRATFLISGDLPAGPGDFLKSVPPLIFPRLLQMDVAPHDEA